MDGLRAVAVTMVLLFHANLGFSGGYVGVDVFFVISGYLITGLILKRQEAGQFSVVDFWVRRTRRIYPAATAMTVAALIAGAAILLPSDFQELGESTVAQQLMLSNFFFWKHADYFDGPSELKPLLHTWSLAVEEQFYVCYPLLLIFLHRRGRRLARLVLGGILVGSLAVSEYGLLHHEEATFFLLPTRAWELLVGGLVCYLPPPSRLKQWVLMFGSWLSLSAIVASGWIYTPDTKFPGVHALVPCGGTAVVIYANSIRPSLPGLILALRPCVFVGKISYSLYLWHWPILAFLRYQQPEPLSRMQAFAALAAAVVAATLSWRLIETPFRTGAVLGSVAKLFATTASALCLLVTAGLLVSTNEGFAVQRFGRVHAKLLREPHDHEFHFRPTVDDVRADKLRRFGDLNAAPTVLVWGDSHGMALMPAIDLVCRELGAGGVQATAGGTLPLLGFSTDRKRAAPPKFAEEVLSYCERNSIRTVVLAGYWHRDALAPQFEPSLRETVQTLRRIGCKLIILQDVPDQGVHPEMEIVNAIKRGRDLGGLGITLDEHRRTQAAADAAILALRDETVIVADPTPYLVSDGGRCGTIIDGERVYFDNDHLTVAGSMRLVPLFREALAQASEGRKTDRRNEGKDDERSMGHQPKVD